MTIYSGYLSFGLPDNSAANQLLLYSGNASTSATTLIDTVSYTYPTKSIIATLDMSGWYAIQFRETSTGWASPPSSAVAGSGYLGSAPFLAATSQTDGANFATVNDVYDRSTLTTTDVSPTNVQYSIDVARGYLDNVLSSRGIDRYWHVFNYDVSRRKYNATLRLLKDVEINLALSLVYRQMADNKLMSNVRGATTTTASVSIGQTSIGGAEDPSTITIGTQIATYLDALSARFNSYAMSLLSTLLPTYIPIKYGENGTGYGTSWKSYTNTAYLNNFALDGGTCTLQIIPLGRSDFDILDRGGC